MGVKLGLSRTKEGLSM